MVFMNRASSNPLVFGNCYDKILGNPTALGNLSATKGNCSGRIQQEHLVVLTKMVVVPVMFPTFFVCSTGTVYAGLGW